MSSIGVGTAGGGWDEQVDRGYCRSVIEAFERGVNVVDTADSYRGGRSERAVGAALRQLFGSGRGRRDEVMVVTKGGYFPFEEDPPLDAPAWIRENVIDAGLARPEEIVNDWHCIAPAYLGRRLSASLEQLGLDRVDVYYIHNPELQLDSVSRAEFDARMRAAFELLERAAADGRIQFYGAATWHGFRRPPEARDYLSLGELVNLAREVGGEGHRFRFVELPFNLGMLEALTMPNQFVGGEQVSALAAAQRLGITVMCSAPIRQGKLARHLPEIVAELFPDASTDAQRALQFVRSVPEVTTALVGMSSPAHVAENLALAKIPPGSLS